MLGFSQAIDSLKQDTFKLETKGIVDSINPKDTVKISDKKNDNKLTQVVEFSAEDSIVIDLENKLIFMYGKGNLNTEGMKLDAPDIQIDLEKSELTAYRIEDTSGRYILPVFEDENQTYTAQKMRYNFKTRKGIVYNVITEEEQGFLHGEKVKIHPNKEIHIKNGKFTTCNRPHPHFYIELTKAKVLPAKHRIITGPFFLVIADVPLPIGLPFGFFPNSQKSTSGFIFPTPYDEPNGRGFGLTDGGYYWAVNDKMDMKLLGDFFTSGSWSMKYNFRFVKRYKFNSSFNFSYTHVRNGEKILRDFNVSNTYSISATYNQDAKARLNSNFSANIQFIKGNYRQFNARDINDFTNNTTASSISYQKKFAGTPFNLSINANSRQNLSDSTINLVFPTLNLNMNRIYPLKFLSKVPKNTWYEKIGITSSIQFKNSVFTQDSFLFKHPDTLLKMMRNGVNYKVNANTSFRVFKYFNVTPNFSYTGRIYSHKIVKNQLITQRIEQDSVILDTTYVNDTIWKMAHNYNFNFSASINTAIYGLFNLNIGRIKAIRHVLRPSVGFTYQPDFSNQFWGFYYPDPQDSTRMLSYTPDGIFGNPPVGPQKKINFRLNNNFEMKVRTNDTTHKDGFKKVKLVDNMNFGGAYNFAVDSLNWQDFTFSLNTSPFPATTFSLNSSFTPYAYDLNNGKDIDKWIFYDEKVPLRLRNLNFSFSTRLNQSSFSKNKKTSKPENNAVVLFNNWGVNLNFNFNYSQSFDNLKKIMGFNLRQYLTLSFKTEITKNFSMAVSSGYDFAAGKVTSTTFSFRRDLHCWEMSLSVTPFGRMKSYYFVIRPKASIFESIKFERRRDWQDYLLR